MWVTQNQCQRHEVKQAPKAANYKSVFEEKILTRNILQGNSNRGGRGNVDKSQSGFDKSQPEVNKSKWGLTKADTGLTKASL